MQARSPAAAAAPASSSTQPGTHFPLLELPDAALEGVLRALAAPDRQLELIGGLPPRFVLSAARTCSRLHTAATAVLDSISVISATQQRVDSLQLYLARHGQHVASVTARGPTHQFPGENLPEMRALPSSCSSLRALSLEMLQVQLGSGDDSPGLLQAASGLTSLRLSRCSTAEQPESVAAAVAALTQLQHLEMSQVQMQPGVLPGSMLAPLTGLTSLRLEYNSLENSSLEHLTALSGLRRLQLADSQHEPCLTLAGLTGVRELQRLTALELADFSFVVSLPGLPSALQRLAVRRCGSFGPQTLAGLSQLQELDLSCTPLNGGAGDVAALLRHVGQMTQLTQLGLHGAFQDDAPDAASYAALTVSSSLVQLCLPEFPLPGAWQAMFGGTKLLPRLQELQLGRCSDAAARMTAADMAAVVRCCPALQAVQADIRMLQADVDLSTLSALSQLCKLTITAGCSDERLAQLAQLTGLQSVSIDTPPAITNDGLAHLTALTRLTSLYVHGSHLSTNQHGGLELSSMDPARPDVAAQLGALLERARLEEP